MNFSISSRREEDIGVTTVLCDDDCLNSNFCFLTGLTRDSTVMQYDYKLRIHLTPQNEQILNNTYKATIEYRVVSSASWFSWYVEDID